MFDRIQPEIFLVEFDQSSLKNFDEVDYNHD